MPSFMLVSFSFPFLSAEPICHEGEGRSERVGESKAKKERAFPSSYYSDSFLYLSSPLSSYFSITPSTTMYFPTRHLALGQDNGKQKKRILKYNRFKAIIRSNGFIFGV